MSAKKPMALVILDGWGYREDNANNAINNANTPVMDSLIANNPNTLISASGMDVGLPDGQMGNSEVGHTNIGAGRIVYQDLTRITKSIADGEFQQTEALVAAMDKAIKAGKAVHLLGLMSPGGVHSHEDHIYAAIEMAAARGAEKIYLHCFLDGRDTPPRSAEGSLQRFQELFAKLGKGRIASLIGRYYAMDRDNNWDRVQKSYDLLVEAKAEYTFDSAVAGLEAAYAREENDEFVKATEIKTEDQQSAAIEDGDAVIFMNYRADRAREITRAFVPDFDGFERAKFPAVDFVMLTQYAADIPLACAFPPASLENTYGEWLSKAGKTQLRISETEKYAHVTFFFNGGVESEFAGEERQLVASPKVATYDLQPEMSAPELTEKLVAAIKSGKYDAIICNYPNGDMVGHTGVYDAAVKACEALDECIGKVVEAIKEVDGQLLITADHGNAEMMVNPETGGVHTAHTNLPVPLIYVGSKDLELKEGGKLSDLAPTMLALTDMEIPAEMSGEVLYK
ncbi:2,3-bisphosphoglycerate-independent phosphoglycerate mutase [Vibrio aestuarianus]|uniref:2,3-bisphosphoglycerate-independent phosphoglycerate mutase n=1 Tax=Vibrio aestuarianus TaxID=28171 RepID=A0ABN8TUV0_9VIBR|nr:2,3-bisphosphoglycerate-independent phosphoglycerate mutase [Vibrio aestuarianus]MDE1214821.1 2,3-bisphosphoglycerate-independent phosphoglycerate mutase [Vibrio aestuarianus]MDE1218034.1 2,3-bisphosphoglycerate-independent phosphoglycerate mutase [Vibrio aestuarianus]MDE1226571.1 2,3-bisphosphoglycerate-independent phosphoglycerate mutase [Vibrio aestuarianus]MDE1257768.1 2,3-bisphosphoglycerate-independent phosphoglycerate mutase [Vibrio aestuarianus]MDE1261944.1 2,3-bisphosphoglycerate-i